MRDRDPARLATADKRLPQARLTRVAKSTGVDSSGSAITSPSA